MTSTLVDSNILIDLFEPASHWTSWSAKRAEEAVSAGPLVINPIVYAEISVAFLDEQLVEQALPPAHYVREALPWRAAFEAGCAHRRYRRRGGQRDRTLPDFLIGAHAAVKGYRLLTRDARRYRTYFPAVSIIAPDTHP